jgi:hypothetical protein
MGVFNIAWGMGQGCGMYLLSPEFSQSFSLEWNEEGRELEKESRKAKLKRNFKEHAALAAPGWLLV